MTEAGVSLPLMVSGTVEPMGTMLAGQDVDALYASLEHLDLFSIGLNCATGPEFMTDHLRTLSDVATCFVSVYPNAGLPDEHGHYEETAESLAHKMRRFVEEGWVERGRRLLRDDAGPHPRAGPPGGGAAAARARRRIARRAVSGIESVYPSEDLRPVIVGERTNVIGSRRFKELIVEEKFEEASEIGRAQVKGGAQVLDVCLANPDRDEAADMDRFMDFVTRKVKAPLMIDSTDAARARAGAPQVPGQGPRQLDQPGGRRGALRARGPADPHLRRGGGGGLHRRGQAAGHGGHPRSASWPSRSGPTTCSPGSTESPSAT